MLSKNLQDQLIRNKMQKADLAQKSEVSYPYVTALVNGTRTNPTMKVLKKLATALNCKVSDLTGGRGGKK